MTTPDNRSDPRCDPVVIKEATIYQFNAYLSIDFNQTGLWHLRQDTALEKIHGQIEGPPSKKSDSELKSAPLKSDPRQ